MSALLRAITCRNYYILPFTWRGMPEEEYKCEVKCRNCDTWFPYPIRFSSWEEYYTGKPRKKQVAKCPECGEEIEMTKETVREAKGEAKRKKGKI